MPLSSDEKVNETARHIFEGLKAVPGTRDGHRPVHARGRLVLGTFMPTSEASTLSKAPHFTGGPTPVIVRFSSATGLPEIPDTDGSANPRGMAIRFVLGNNGHAHTDIVAHSTPRFPMRTGDGFLKLMKALGDGSISQFLEENPSAAAFVREPKPSPASFATERYFGIHAFKLVSSEGKETFIRYRIVPDAGHSVLSEAETALKSKSYLYDELSERLATDPATFKLIAQIAEEGDITDDATNYWPEVRKQVELGTIKLEHLESESSSKKEEQRIIYDPIPRVDGIEPSADPLLETRASVYLQSGKQRRAAPAVA